MRGVEINQIVMPGAAFDVVEQRSKAGSFDDVPVGFQPEQKSSFAQRTLPHTVKPDPTWLSSCAMHLQSPCWFTGSCIFAHKDCWPAAVVVVVEVGALCHLVRAFVHVIVPNIASQDWWRHTL